MSELNANDFFILAELTPGEVTFENFSELKEYLKKGLSIYDTTVYTSDNLEDAIYDRDQLKAIKKKLTDKKKEIEKAYTLPYETVKEMLDELIDMVKEPLNRADEVIKECERQKKRKQIIRFAKEEVSVLGAYAEKTLKCPAFYNNKWLNVSYSMNRIKSEIRGKVVEIQNNIEIIEKLGGDDIAILMAKYFYDLSMDGIVDFLESVKKQKDEFEKRSDTIETVVLPTKLEQEQKNLADVCLSKLIKITTTKEQFEEIFTFLQLKRIHYEEIDDISQNRTCSNEVEIEESPVDTLSCEKVKAGDSVKLCEMSTGIITEYRIQTNSDVEADKLSEALLDKVLGYVFLWIDEHGERIEYKIVDIER